LINWDIIEHKSEITNVAYETLQGGLYEEIPEFSHLKFNIKAERKSGYYFWNVLIPFAILIMSTLLAYRLRESRAEVIYSLLLLMVMFQFSIGLQLPEVPYLTQLDGIIMIGYLVVFTLIVLITVKRRKRKRQLK
jgi:cytochrome c biogenesis factor